MDQGFYLDVFRRYYRRGLVAHEKGDAGAARGALLKAAEVLYKLAAASSGELRRTRKEKAGKILALAKSIGEGSAGPVGRSADGKARPAAGEPDEAAETRWVVTDKPSVRMADVAGLADVKAAIRKRVIWPFQHPEVTARYRKRAGGGVLLYGPPGTGKTMIAKAVAAEVDATFFSVRCSDVMSKWVGEAERNLQQLFEAARQHERAVVFLDETEAIVAKRGSGSTVMDRVIPEFLAQVDGVGGRHGGLLLLGATNRPWDMDDAALRPGRFDELIYVPLPDATARERIIAAALEAVPAAEDVSPAALAERTEGYSGADCVAVCEAAKDAPYEREIDSGTPQRIEPGDIDAALARVRPSVSRSRQTRYETFERTRE